MRRCSVAIAVACLGLLSCCRGEPDSGEESNSVTTWEDHPTPNSIRRTQTVPIHVDVPEGLGAYTGVQPVTFGIPFVRGTVLSTDGFRVTDTAGEPLHAQFKVTATWDPPAADTRSSPSWVRWLLVDALVPIKGGFAPALTLHAGPDVDPHLPASGVSAQELQDGRIAVATGARGFTLGGTSGLLGDYRLTDSNGVLYHAVGDDVVVENYGPTRSVVRATGLYVDATGRAIARHVTRFRFWANQPFVRVYHTLIWLQDDSVGIRDLTFRQRTIASSSAVSSRTGGNGVNLALGPLAALSLAQTEWDTVDVNGTSQSGPGTLCDGAVPSARHVAFFRRSGPDVGSAQNVTVRLYGRNVGPDTICTRLYDPDGTMIEDATLAFAPTDNHTFSSAELLSVAVPLASPAGVYAVEVLSIAQPIPLAIRTSTNSAVVHHASSTGFNATSPSWGGQLWFRPTGPVTASADGVHIGRVVALGPNGQMVGSTTIVPYSAEELQQNPALAPWPKYSPAAFSPQSLALHSLVLGNDRLEPRVQMSGVRPFVSATSNAWFDPCADMAELVGALGLSCL